jgi:hypothetical protein
MGYADPKIGGVPVRIVDEELQKRARGAQVMMSYRVWRDPFAGFDQFKTALTLEKACEFLREGPHSSMQVLFRWRLGDRQGDGSVSYIREENPTATNQFIERMTRSLIERAIAEDLAAGRYIRDTRERRPREQSADAM